MSNSVMAIQLNGEVREVSSDLTIQALLEELDLLGRRVAVEVNQEIVSKDDFDRFVLSPNDVIEIVSFVGGG